MAKVTETRDVTARMSAAGLSAASLYHARSLVRGAIGPFRAAPQPSGGRTLVQTGAAITLLMALTAPAAALAAGLEDLRLSAGWAALVVGSASTATAFAMAPKGMIHLKTVNRIPTRTARNARPDAETIKEITNVR